MQSSITTAAPALAVTPFQLADIGRRDDELIAASAARIVLGAPLAAPRQRG